MLRANAADLTSVCLVGNSLAWYHLAGNLARRGESAAGGCAEGDCAAGDCAELARLAALVEVEGESAVATLPRASSADSSGGYRPIETPLPLGDADDTVERALNATSVHVFRRCGADEGVR